MATGIKTSTFINTLSQERSVSLNLVERFELWAEKLESKRFFILAAILLVQGNIIIPPALLIISNINIGLTALGVAVLTFCTFGVLVSNLVLAPMKVVVGTFAINLLLILSVVAIHLVHLL